MGYGGGGAGALCALSCDLLLVQVLYVRVRIGGKVSFKSG